MSLDNADPKFAQSPTPEGKPGATRFARGKIKPLEELGELAAAARAAGKTVVLVHGVFDLVHMGHVRHLEAAHREGDVLIVTVTADEYVNKGPGRPIFHEVMRAEMVAALEYVDWVGINDSATAEPVLDAVGPDVYVKGSDYENPEDDVTGNIEVERDAIEKRGGRMVFTDDIKFSSSALINRYLDVYDAPLRDFLDEMREGSGLTGLLDLIERVKDYRILLVGDTIVDEYLYVLPLGKSAKENIIATKSKDREIFAGGVIAAANHVASFCREVEVITCLGGQDSHEDLIRNSLLANVTLTPVHRDGVPTTCKRRYVDTSYTRKLFEVYFMDDSRLENPIEQAFGDLITERAKDFDLVIVTDFGHGLISPKIVDTLVANSRFLAVNTQVNAGNQGFNLISKYPRADYVCLDEPEARLAVSDKYTDLAAIAARHLPEIIDCDKIVITQGRHGCIASAAEQSSTRIPALTDKVVDTIGAGDAFFVVTAPLVAAGGEMGDIGLIGNAAGAMMVGIVGHRSSIDKVSLMKYLTAVLK
jgi:rfaE bifunctional protein nucleotidyltransferase chain/domain